MGPVMEVQIKSDTSDFSIVDLDETACESKWIDAVIGFLHIFSGRKIDAENDGTFIDAADRTDDS